MKLIRISSMTVRVTFLLALILGLGFWLGWVPTIPSFTGIHMLIGIIFVLGLWGIGFAQIQTGNVMLGALIIIVGLAVIIVGLEQVSWQAFIPVEVMNSIHLILNILAIGLAEMVVARSKRLAKAQAA